MEKTSSFGLKRLKKVSIVPLYKTQLDNQQKLHNSVGETTAMW